MSAISYDKSNELYEKVVKIRDEIIGEIRASAQEKSTMSLTETQKIVEIFELSRRGASEFESRTKTFFPNPPESKFVEMLTNSMKSYFYTPNFDRELKNIING